MSISCFEEAKHGMDMMEEDIYYMFYCDTWWDKLQTVKICLVFFPWHQSDFVQTAGCHVLVLTI